MITPRVQSFLSGQVWTIDEIKEPKMLSEMSSLFIASRAGRLESQEEIRAQQKRPRQAVQQSISSGL
jgi:hypothetical protein